MEIIPVAGLDRCTVCMKIKGDCPNLRTAV